MNRAGHDGDLEPHPHAEQDQDIVCARFFRGGRIVSIFRHTISCLIAVLLAVASISGGQTGIQEKKPVFGGACRLCPWGAMAEVVQTAMKPYGYDVQICYNCNAADAPRIVSEARMPPPYKPDPAVPAILAPRNAPGLGAVDFGAVAIQFLRNAYRGTGVYAHDKPRTNLRLIANIQDPSYLLVAAKAETGITDLAEIRQKRWPVRILVAGIGGDPTAILARYGLSKEVIEAAGGHIGNSPEDRENFDVVIGGGGPMTTAPEWRIWTEISQKFNLNFIELPDDLLAKLAKDGDAERGIIPAGLYRGIERPIPTIVRTGTAIYGRTDMPDDFAYLVAKAMDEQQQLLQWRHLNFSYNVHTVWNGYEVPLHPGAARYYKEKGYMVDAQAAKQPFTLTLSTDKPVVKAGDRVFINIIFTNISDHDVDCTMYWINVLDRNFQYDVRDEYGQPDPERVRDRHEDMESNTDPCIIGPGEKSTTDGMISRVYDFTRPGKYTLQVSRHIWGDDNRPETIGIVQSNKPDVKSNTITITVLPADEPPPAKKP